MPKSVDKDYLETLGKISKAITSDLYLEDILKLIVTLTAKAINAKICSLWLYDEGTNELKIKATQAVSEEYLKERPLKLGEGIVGMAAKDKAPVYVKNVLEDPRYKEKSLAKKEGLVSMLSAPMYVKNKIIGVINCYTTTTREFTKNDIELFSAVANQAAVAIENTQLMVRTRIIEEELQIRKTIERAKGMLMRSKNMGEEEAYNIIRKWSMNKRISMKEVAEAIIISHEIEGSD